MPHALKMKDGKLLTPFGIRDLLDAVEDYAGEELRREIEEYIETNVEDIDDYEKEYDRMERDGERLADHQRSVLCNIRDEVDALDALLQDTRLNRRRMQGAVRSTENCKHGALAARTRTNKRAYKYAPYR